MGGTRLEFAKSSGFLIGEARTVGSVGPKIEFGGSNSIAIIPLAIMKQVIFTMNKHSHSIHPIANMDLFVFTSVPVK